MKIDFEVGNCVLMNLFLVLLGSNSTELLWFKWCLLILGVFPKQCWLLNYYISKKYVDILYINLYFINVWCAHWLLVLWKTCGTTWIYLYSYVWIYLYILGIMNGLFLWAYWNVFWKPMESREDRKSVV